MKMASSVVFDEKASKASSSSTTSSSLLRSEGEKEEEGSSSSSSSSYSAGVFQLNSAATYDRRDQNQYNACALSSLSSVLSLNGSGDSSDISRAETTVQSISYLDQDALVESRLLGLGGSRSASSLDVSKLSSSSSSLLSNSYPGHSLSSVNLELSFINFNNGLHESFDTSNGPSSNSFSPLDSCHSDYEVHRALTLKPSGTNDSNLYFIKGMSADHCEPFFPFEKQSSSSSVDRSDYSYNDNDGDDLSSCNSGDDICENSIISDSTIDCNYSTFSQLNLNKTSSSDIHESTPSSSLGRMNSLIGDFGTPVSLAGSPPDLDLSCADIALEAAFAREKSLSSSSSASSLSSTATSTRTSLSYPMSNLRIGKLFPSDIMRLELYGDDCDDDAYLLEIEDSKTLMPLRLDFSTEHSKSDNNSNSNRNNCNDTESHSSFIIQTSNLSASTSSSISSFSSSLASSNSLVCPSTPPFRSHMWTDRNTDIQPSAGRYFKTNNFDDDQNESLNASKIFFTVESESETSTSVSSSASSISFERDFEIQGQIGSGTFSDCYKVKCKVDGAHYAVKKTKRPFRSRRERDWLLQEVSAMKSLDLTYCKYIIHLVSAWQQDGHFFIQTELADNGTLFDFLGNYAQRECSIALNTIWHLIFDICSGLGHIHKFGLVHLDIKPSNLFIGHNGLLKIGDFGMSVSQGLGRDDGHEGDIRYMAPELLHSLDRVPESDMFSLGIMLFEIANIGITSQFSLPSEGLMWHLLRENGADLGIIEDIVLKDIIKSLLSYEPKSRTTSFDLLSKLEKVVSSNRGEEDGHHDTDMFNFIRHRTASMLNNSSNNSRIRLSPSSQALGLS